MTESKNLTIVLLCVSATVLATVLVLVNQTAAPAYADTPVRAGDYIMIAGEYSESTDLVYVVDIVAQKVNTYVFNPASNELILRHDFNLKPVFQQSR